MKRPLVVGVMLTVVCAPALAGVVRSQPSATPPRVKMTLRALATPVNGPSFEQASADVDLALGESGTTAFSASTNLCHIAAGGNALVSEPNYRWKARFTLVSVQIDTITVDVTIDRHADEPPAVTQETRHLVLSEGAPHLFDFVHTDGSGTCRTRSIALEVSAAFTEAPALARELLSYDLWLTHRDAAGRQWTRHEVRSARQGEVIGFRFRPLQWTLDALVSAGTHDTTVTEHVSGSIRGRIRDDGKIDVSFQTLRELASGEGSGGERGGQKIFVVQSGEPVRIELPPANGQHAISRSSGTSTRVDYAQVFGGHTTAVIVKVDRIDP